MHRREGKRKEETVPKKPPRYKTLHYSPPYTPRCYSSTTGFKAENIKGLNYFLTQKETDYYFKTVEISGLQIEVRDVSQWLM